MGDESNVPASLPSPASPTPASTTTEPRKKKSWPKRIVKAGAVLFLLLVVLLIVGPTIASATFLTGTVRGQLRAQFGEGADVSKASFGWSEGLVVDGIKIPAASWARVKDRPVVTLEHVGAKFSVPGAASAAMSGGEVSATLEAKKASIYLELLPDGKTNVPVKTAEKAPETRPADAKPGEKPAEAKPAEKPATASEPMKPLAVSVKSILNVQQFDVEIADMTSSTGTVQRTKLTGLRMGCEADLAKDLTARLDTLKDGKAEDPTFAFEKLEIWKEPKEGPKTLVLSVVNPRFVTKAVFLGPRAASADQAPTKAVALAHQLETSPVFSVEQVAGEGYDLRDLRVTLAVGTESGRKTAAFRFSGLMKGPKHDGKIDMGVTADLSSKPKLPVKIEIGLGDVDIAGIVAEQSPTLLPILGGCLDPKSKETLPTFSFSTKGSVSTSFDRDEKVEKDPTLNSILTSGQLGLGAGSLAGSTILRGFLEAFDRLELEDVLAKAMGPEGLSFDSVKELFDVKDGVVTIPKLAVLRKNFGLDLQGSCTFAGHYKLSMHFEPVVYERMRGEKEKAIQDAAKILECVDKAGGIGIEGDLGGSYTLRLPPADVLARALIAGAGIELFRSHCPKAAARLDKELGKLGTSVDQIVADPTKTASDVAHKEADKAEQKGEQAAEKAIDKNSKKIADKTGIDVNKAKDNLLGGLSGKEEKKPDEQKPDEKKEEKKPIPIPKIPNPFGGD